MYAIQPFEVLEVYYKTSQSMKPHCCDIISLKNNCQYSNGH